MFMIDSCQIESLRGGFALGLKTDLGPFQSAFACCSYSHTCTKKYDPDEAKYDPAGCSVT